MLKRIEFLLRKTIENGAMPGEEVAAVQLAHMIARQSNADMQEFRVALEAIGTPPRYMITQDGFLVPTQLLRREEPPKPRPVPVIFDPAPEDARPPSSGNCRHSPTGEHFMVRRTIGSFISNVFHCAHCGFVQR